MLDVGPELFQNLRDRIRGKILAQPAHVIPQVRLTGIIGVAHRRRDAIPHHFREIEAGPSAVGLGHEDARRGVPRARPFGAMSLPKITRVFMEQDGKQALRHVIADGLIGISSPIAVCESRHTLAEKRMLIGELRDSRQAGAQQEQRIVNRVLGGDR